MFNKLVAIGIMAGTVSGCTAGFRPALEDYQGIDASRIRTATNGNTALQFFEKRSGCYKKILERRITSGFSILGFPVTGSKLLGMPPSHDIYFRYINEYKIKPGQLVRVIHYWSQRGYHQNNECSYTYNFIPQENHDYDIIISENENLGYKVSINDLAPGAKMVNWKDDEICPSGIFDK